MPSFINYLKHLLQPPQPIKPNIIKRDSHCISRKLISKNALKVLYHLKRNHFQAYLVGGSVRDILLGVTPKDFDIATNAHPEQIKRIFYNCLLIGKRFRIAHIRFPGETIEVTTFRGTASGSHRRLSAAGMLLRDNVYGTLHEDVWRRDFSINALYYNIQDFSIVDYCQGLEDIQNKCIRIIGDATKRYQEDPVRLLRAIRLAAKFPTFSFEESTKEGLLRHASLLSHISTSRLFEETLKLFHSGHAVFTYQLLKKYGLLNQLLPTTNQAQDKSEQDWLTIALQSIDQRFHNRETLYAAFLFAILLWPAFKKTYGELVLSQKPKGVVALEAMQAVMDKQRQSTMLTRLCMQTIKDIWMMQPSLVQHNPNRTKKLLASPQFAQAYDFLLLRIKCGELPATLGEWWTNKLKG